MFRFLLLAYGVLVIGCVGLSLLTRQPRYLAWARRILVGGVVLGLLLGVGMLLRRVIKGLI